MKSLRISKKDIAAFVLCFSFIPVHAIQLLIKSNGYLILMLVSGAFVVAKAIIDKTILKSFMFISWTILMLWMMLCSYIGDQKIIYSVYYVGKVALWFLANECYFNNGSLRLLKMARKYVGFLIIVTFIQQIVAPDMFGIILGSWNRRTFFASDNYLGYYYTAYIALCFILDFKEKGEPRLRTYVMTAVCMASIIISWAVKNVIGIAILILYIAFVYKKKLARFFAPKTLTILFVVIFVGMVFFNVQQNFSDIVQRLFGKDTTFSVRYYVWTQAIQNIRRSPVFGYGIPEGAHVQLQYNFSGNARSSHNIVLELAMNGGIVAAAIYFFSVGRCLIHNEKRFKGNYSYEYLFLVFNVFLFYLIQMASGSIYYPFYYMPLILLDNLDKIIYIKERKQKNAPETYMHRYKLRRNNQFRRPSSGIRIK